MPLSLENFKQTFNRIDRDHLNLLDELYEPDATLIDPFHELHGIAELRTYFASMYDGVTSCQFEYGEEAVNGATAMLAWRMTLAHRRLNGGRPFTVPGVSVLHFRDKVLHHRDYFDAGALIYERVPVLGFVVRKIRESL